NFGDSSSSANTSDLPNPNHCYENTGFYDISLTVTSDQGCVSSLTVPQMIQVFAIPIAEFTPTPNPVSVYDPKVTLNNGSSSDVVYWNYHFGDGDSISPDIKNPVHSYPKIASSSYVATLDVRNADGCVSHIEHTIEITPEFSFYIPNAFTPKRDDGHNDTFFGKGVGIVEYHLWIFDRWGNMVFNTRDINTGWDGRANNGVDIAQQDVFVWKVKLKDVFNKWHDYIGTVTLVK
ncbi:MAG TPA: PKD domain-containing protein, partial [Bacteroidia bacterium]|nr:PKD domain-containing protein [Bacteroidia bacterium]